MPAKLIIWCPGRPALNGHKRRSFLWNPAFNCFVHEGRVFEEKEFNAAVELVFKKNQDLRPCVRVVQFSDAVPTPTLDGAMRVAELEAQITLLHAKSGVADEKLTARIAELEAQLAAPRPPDAASEAQRIAPHKLKGQPGKKPAAPAPSDEV